MILALACVATVPDGGPAASASDGAEDAEVAPGGAGVESEDVPVDPTAFVFADTGILDLAIELDEGSLRALAEDPKSYVTGTVRFGGQTYSPVGVALKGSSTYQWITGKPAWKIRFDEFDEGLRFHGLKRLTLNSNYWDGAQMAETLAYRTFREADVPAPRTGYATVSLNGDADGLYTIVEAMDDDFMDRNWPGSNGGIYEMQRTCDVNLDCSCYELQDSGPEFDPDGITRACAAAATGNESEIRAHWDWKRLTTFIAVEYVVNHPDSYSFNLNNYFLYHDPETDFASISPWGADSTFSYAYPPDADQACEPGLFDDFGSFPRGYLATWCRANEACWADVSAAMLDVADQLEANDLAGRVTTTHDRIAAAVEAETRWPWGMDTFEGQVACFQTWITDRPERVRAFVAAQAY